MDKRTASIKRKTSETSVTVTLLIDGTGKSQVNTGIGMLDHLLAQVARHGLFDLRLRAKGDLHVGQHHTVEDIAISLGKAFGEALGERQGIVRMAHALVPMDEALAMVAVDIGGRGHAELELAFKDDSIGGLKMDLISHFLDSFAQEARLNLHTKILSGANDHHKAEAIFKALGRTLDAATRVDERIAGEIPSTKGTIEKG